MAAQKAARGRYEYHQLVAPWQCMSAITTQMVLPKPFVYLVIIIYGPEWQFLTWLATSSTSRGKSRSTV